MSCSGLHCAGCGAGAGVPAVALLALEGGAWVATHVIEVAFVSGACAVVAFAAVVALVRRGDRRDALQATRGTLLVTRADAAPLPQASRGTPPAIEQHSHFHFGDEEAAVRVLRKALAP
jgi:hypothetical protein